MFTEVQIGGFVRLTTRVRISRIPTRFTLLPLARYLVTMQWLVGRLQALFQHYKLILLKYLK